MASGLLPKSPVSSSLCDEVPHIFIPKSHLEPREFLISSAKRLLQHNLPIADSRTAIKSLRFSRATLRLATSRRRLVAVSHELGCGGNSSGAEQTSRLQNSITTKCLGLWEREWRRRVAVFRGADCYGCSFQIFRGYRGYPSRCDDPLRCEHGRDVCGLCGGRTGPGRRDA